MHTGLIQSRCSLLIPKKECVNINKQCQKRDISMQLEKRVLALFWRDHCALRGDHFVHSGLQHLDRLGCQQMSWGSGLIVRGGIKKNWKTSWLYLAASLEGFFGEFEIKLVHFCCLCRSLRVLLCESYTTGDDLVLGWKKKDPIPTFL